MEYNKLVRDLVPVMLKHNGIECYYYNASNQDMKQLLVDRLAQENQEFLAEDFNGEKALQELADIMEVCYGIAKNMGYTERDLNNARRDKRNMYGGFETGVVLVESEEDIPKEEILEDPDDSI